MNKTIHNPWASTDDGTIKCDSLTHKTLDGALEVMWESFLPGENLCTAVDILSEPGAAAELLKTCVDTAKDGISVVARDTDSNEVIGVIFNKVQVPAGVGESYYEIFSKNCKHKASKAIIDFTKDIDSRADLFKRYNVNCLMEVMYIATKNRFKQKKIAQLLVSATLELGKRLSKGQAVKTPLSKNGEVTNIDDIPKLISGLTTSNYSQKLGEKFGFDNVLEVKYEDFWYNGKKYSEKIGNIHRTCRVVAKRLSSL